MIEGKILILNVVIIASLLGLYIYGSAVPPEKIDVAEVGKHNGRYVMVRGVVLKGGQNPTFLRSSENFKYQVSIYDVYGQPLPLGHGEVAGVVKNKNRYEIVVRKRMTFRFKKKYETTIPVENNPQRFTWGLNNLKFPGRGWEFNLRGESIKTQYSWKGHRGLTGKKYLAREWGPPGQKTPYFLGKIPGKF